MMSADLFERASRLKLPFITAQGQFSVDDLWDLPLTSKTNKVCLDAIGMGLLKQLKDTGDVISLVDETRKSDDVLQLKFDIVKHIIDVRKAEQKTEAEKSERRQKNQRIMALIQEKEIGQLGEKSVDELKALLANED